MAAPGDASRGSGSAPEGRLACDFIQYPGAFNYFFRPMCTTRRSALHLIDDLGFRGPRRHSDGLFGLLPGSRGSCVGRLTGRTAITSTGTGRNRIDSIALIIPDLSHPIEPAQRTATPTSESRTVSSTPMVKNSRAAAIRVPSGRRSGRVAFSGLSSRTAGAAGGEVPGNAMFFTLSETSACRPRSM